MYALGLVVEGEVSAHPLINSVPNDITDVQGTAVTSLTFDPWGHVIGAAKQNFDTRFARLNPDGAEQTITGDLIISGRVVVQGDLTMVSASVVTTGDNIITVNQGQIGSAITAN